jgi:hypothetical protein
MLTNFLRRIEIPGRMDSSKLAVKGALVMIAPRGGWGPFVIAS